MQRILWSDRLPERAYAYAFGLSAQSDPAPDDLGQYEKWRPYLHDLGVVEVKHGVRVEVVNFYTDEVGSSELAEKSNASGDNKQ